MAHVNLYHTPVSTRVALWKLVRSGSFTYAIGRIVVATDNVNDQFYIAKIDLQGILLWQKRFVYPDIDTSSSYRPQFVDIVEMPETGDLILLGADATSFLLLKLREDGEMIWANKYYDKSETPIIYKDLNARARLFKLNEETLVLKITETHSEEKLVKRIDHKFLRIEPVDGKVLASRQIISENPILIIRDEEVRKDELVLFGYQAGIGAIITIDAGLDMVGATGIYYDGILTGFNYLHIYAVSPVNDGKYSVLGSFYHYDPKDGGTRDYLDFVLNDRRNEWITRLVLEHLVDFTEPLPNRFSRFFITEVTEDHSAVTNERLLSKDFNPTCLTIHNNPDGIFFSVGNALHKLNPALTSSEWVKKIRVQEVPQNDLVVNRTIGASFDAHSLLGEGTTANRFSIASTDLDYYSCRTESVDEKESLSDQKFAIRDIEVTIKDYSRKDYEKPEVEPVNIESAETQELCPSIDPQPDLNQSTITANPIAIAADGSSTSQITVVLRNAQGIIINPGSATVQINTNAGTWNGAVNTAGNGIYTRELKSSNTQETATLTFTVNSLGTSPNTASVQFMESGMYVDISRFSSLQSPHLYLQAAGSVGSDSTVGKHLRWAFRGVLGEKHLPKGDYATNYVNFNKPNDYIRIYKAAYIKSTVSLHFFSDFPDVVDSANYLWIYNIGDKEFYVRFRNQAKYDEVLLTINPLTNPSQFIGSYGSELIEVENIKELFFKVTCNFDSQSTPSVCRIETMSVTANILVANRVVTNRKSIFGNQLGAPLKLVLENGRAVRWQVFNANLASLDFEFYSQTIGEINIATGWTVLGDYALNLEQAVAFGRLEPAPGYVHGMWQRFNDEAFVNVDNYHQKWNGPTELGDRNIKEVVENYIQLSDDANNFAAVENVPLGNNPDDPQDYMEISNLDMLNFSANDYHIARMLGLGLLDVYGDNVTNVYVAEYHTTADLEDGQGPREVQHLYMSLPTSNSDFRLPVAVDLDQIVPGVFLGGEDGSGELSSLTDGDGYAHDGISRYVSLYAGDLPEDAIDAAFFVTAEEVNLSAITIPVYGGLKYRLNQGNWEKPELSNDPRYNNVVAQGQPFYETRFILLPEPLQAFYVHRQTATGLHGYKSYGINWFSRANPSETEITIETLLKQKNPLLPPSNTNAILIRKESPLLLTSEEEQERLELSSGDKTLVRLTYDYHTFHELKNYNIPLNTVYSNAQLVSPANANNPLVLYPDNQEIFADEVDIFFRNHMPNNTMGKALSVVDHGSNELLSIIATGVYEIVTTGETLVPLIVPGTEGNYIGGIFVSGENRYIIHQITHASQGPVFTVYKKELGESILAGGIPSSPPAAELEAPILVTGGLFMAIENMQSSGSWGTPNPLDYIKVKVGNNWPIHREVIEITDDDDGSVQRMVEKTRGIWGSAQIVPDLQANQIGIYKITFNGFTLAHHPQYNATGVSAEWWRGIARVFTENSVSGGVPNSSRKIFPVIRIENEGTPNNLVIYVQDPSFDPSDPDYDAIQTGSNIKVNFYPGYKVYLYQNNPYGINAQNILPAEGEGVRYSIFGFRSRDINGACDPVSGSCTSKLSVPCVMFAQELIEAMVPELPLGPLYATRPDFFGRATYTLTTNYQHKPHGVLFYRSNDQALLNVLYKKETILEIREQLGIWGGNDEEYLVNRWENFLNFGQLATEGDYRIYPPADIAPGGVKFPNPNKQAFFDWANSILEKLGQPLITAAPGSLLVGDPKIIDFVKGAVYNAFVSLTEMPILYQYLNGENYKPVDKPQVVKDRNGNILPPTNENFEMAPMMKIISESPHQTLFTDFKLDGTSNNLYFYGVKELSSKMMMSDFSPFLGPVKLVNTNPPETPEVKRIVPVLANSILGITPNIQLEVNAYPKVQKIKRLTIYRSFNILDAQSVQTMQLVKVIDLENEMMLDEPVWIVNDYFEDLPEIPFGAGLYYRITVSRQVEYAEADGNVVQEYAPSQVSKIVASLVAESYAPQAPFLKFLSTAPDTSDEIHSVKLLWPKMAYNARYLVYKMNSQGNWIKIHELQTNDSEILLSLTDTDLQLDILPLSDGEGKAIYHHFKVVVENSAEMRSVEEHILSIFDPASWIEV